MNQQIHFVTGKGGVGKSVVAAGIAMKLSEQGKRVLLVELGDQSFYQNFFKLSRVAYAPVPLRPQLDVALWTGTESLREYAHHLLKVEKVADLFFENPVMRTFLNVAPALTELAILGKITSHPRRHGPPLPYDCLVIDAYATGHFLALLDAPAGMGQVVKFGPMGEQSRGISECLRDPKICNYHIVTLPEDLPVKESLELRESILNKTGIEAHCYLNKVLSVDGSIEEIQAASKADGDIGQFSRYVLFQLAKKTEAYNTLVKSFKNVTELPQVFTMDSWEIVEAIKKEIL